MSTCRGSLHGGIEPDLLASTACLGACVAAGNMDLAMKVFEVGNGR
jgi:hypothetical protein